MSKPKHKYRGQPKQLTPNQQRREDEKMERWIIKRLIEASKRPASEQKE